MFGESRTIKFGLIGASGGAASLYQLRAELDRFRFYNRKLTLAEITELIY